MLSSGIKLVLLGVATFFTSVEFPDLTDQPQDSAVHDPGINRCGTGEECECRFLFVVFHLGLYEHNS